MEKYQIEADMHDAEQIAKVVQVFAEREKTNVPVMIFPGWTGDVTTYTANMQAFATEGRSSFMVEVPKEGPDNAIQHNLRCAFEYGNTLNTLSTERIDAIGYSEGALNLVVTAVLHPERFRNIVLVSPVGLTNETSKIELAVNFSREVVSGLIDWLMTPDGRAMMLEVGKSVLGRVFGSPIDSWKQVLGMTSVNLVEELKYLREQGIDVRVLHASDDKLIPLEQMQSLLEQGALDGLQTFEGGHPDFLFESGRVTKIVDSVLANSKVRDIGTERVRTMPINVASS